MEGRESKRSEAFRLGPVSCYDSPGLGAMQRTMGRYDSHRLSVDPMVEDVRAFWRLSDLAMKEKRVLHPRVPKGTGEFHASSLR